MKSSSIPADRIHWHGELGTLKDRAADPDLLRLQDAEILLNSIYKAFQDPSLPGTGGPNVRMIGKQGWGVGSRVQEKENRFLQVRQAGRNDDGPGEGKGLARLKVFEGNPAPLDGCCQTARPIETENALVVVDQEIEMLEKREAQDSLKVRIQRRLARWPYRARGSRHVPEFSGDGRIWTLSSDLDFRVQ